MMVSAKFLGLVACFATAVATNRAAVPLDPLRLTREVEPLAQAIALTLDPAKDDYAESVRVNLTMHSPTTSFRLHALGLIMTTMTVTDRKRVSPG